MLKNTTTKVHCRRYLCRKVAAWQNKLRLTAVPPAFALGFLELMAASYFGCCNAVVAGFLSSQISPTCGTIAVGVQHKLLPARRFPAVEQRGVAFTHARGSRFAASNTLADVVGIAINGQMLPTFVGI